jgi:hypothetical protein
MSSALKGREFGDWVSVTGVENFVTGASDCKCSGVLERVNCANSSTF